VKWVEEFRERAAVEKVAAAIHQTVTRPWSIMEVCGGQTHAIVRFGLDELLPSYVRLIHGPGCPVCVTPLEQIDRALAIAARPSVVFCSFGDMLRVPGSHGDLLSLKARGADVRVMYSPLDAVALAERRPDREIVFFAVGFETTAPANAMAVHEAARRGIENFSMLVSHVLVPPALEAILSAPDSQVDAFLAAGHVCTIMGTSEYEPIVERHRVPIVVTGFEPLDILEGILLCVAQLERGEARVENQYARSVRAGGNPSALAMIREVFTVGARKWRGVGEIERGGLVLAPAYARFDAEARFDVEWVRADEPRDCISGLVLQGKAKPTECVAFGRRCTPETPLGATMVSSEGACAAYFRYRRSETCPASPVISD
jgi:hydrogenase expression/formation protein HypD